MTESEYRTKMQHYRKSPLVHEAGKCWIDMTLAEHEREMKNTRRPGQVSGLRSRLKNLVIAILSQNSGAVKGAEKNV